MRDRRTQFTGKLIAGLFAALLVPACAGELKGDPESFKVTRSASPSETGCSRAPEIFAENCTSCHDPINHFGGLDLDTPGMELRLVDTVSTDPNCATRKLIDPAAPDQSFLLEKLSSNAPECGDPMPYGGELPPEDVECVRAWLMDLVAGGSDGGFPAINADAGAGGDAQ